jgi:hypothetical protein
MVGLVGGATVSTWLVVGVVLDDIERSAHEDLDAELPPPVDANVVGSLVVTGGAFVAGGWVGARSDVELTELDSFVCPSDP